MAVPALVGALSVLVAVPIAWQLERTSDNVGALPDVPVGVEVAPDLDTTATTESTREPVPLASSSSEIDRPSPANAATASVTDRKSEAPTALSDPPQSHSSTQLASRRPPTRSVQPLLRFGAPANPPIARVERSAGRPPATTVHSALLSDLVAPGHPRPTRVRIPRIGLDARVQPVGVDPTSRAVDVPSNGQTVAWYRHSAAPTQPGSAVLTAHVDYNGHRGAFFELRRLQPGDTITIELDSGAREEFEVVARRTYARDELPRRRIFASGGPPVLTLVTCGGGFNATERRYDANVVVFAVPVDPG